jgi:hypothetical protein
VIMAFFVVTEAVIVSVSRLRDTSLDC